MKYFIDFEATQFSEEIISVGCKREDGETFYALVRPVEGKITPFITNLTGITAEMVEEAMSPDTVFEMFYDWAFKDANEMPDFFVWGNSDIDFLRHTFRRTTSMKARIAIGYMCGSIIDFAKRFCKRIKAGTCALIKAYNTLIDGEAIQTHNALDDAVMLSEVYNAVITMPIEKLRKKMNGIASVNSPSLPKWDQSNFQTGTICIVNKKKVATHHFDDINAAVEWIIANKIQEDRRETVNKKNTAQRIRRACRNKQPYFSCSWRCVE